MQVTCSDLNCIHNTAGQCTATDIDHTSDRFCVTGRKKPRDETADLMQAFKTNCRAAQSGYKAKHGRIVK